MAKSLYRLTEGDKAIIAKIPESPNYFTDFYFRGEGTGTWWRPNEVVSDVPEIQEIIEKWERGYAILKRKWQSLNCPMVFTHGDREYFVHFEQDYENPNFHDHHGLIFLPWWETVWKAKQTTRVILGGYGCVAGDSRIYDAQYHEHITVEELVKQKRAPVVLAWTGTRFVEIQAHVPFKKGTKALYKVTLESGKEITVTQDHAFLTSQGWQRLSDASDWTQLRLAVSGHDLLPSNWASSPSAFLEDAQHYWQTTGDFQSDYRAYLHLYDEPLFQAKEIASGVVPSPIDALEHIHWCRHEGDPVNTGQCNCHLQFAHLSTSYSSRLFEHPLDWQLLSQDAAEIFLGVRDQHQDNQSQPESLCRSFCPQFPGEFLLQNDQNDQRAFVHRAYPAAYDSPSIYRGVGTILTEQVVDVKYVGEGGYYDLHVPVWNNYLAEGIVHHNSSKTWFEMVRNAISMATKRYYRCFVIAPYSIQANEVFGQFERLIQGTEYQKRFMADGGMTTKPFPKITVRNDQCIRSTMEFFSIEKNPDKLLNISGDAFHVEQAEQIENIDWLMEIIGSRLRGQVGGRELEGIITFVANSDEAGNPQLWDLFDEAETDPEGVLAIQPTTYDNPHITSRQLKDIEKRMPKDPEAKDRALKGARPTGGGEHFPKSSIEKCKNSLLDDLMQQGRDQKLPGYSWKWQPKAQVVEWEIPPQEDHFYILAADPGYDNPPKRNSAGIMVFDITYFMEQRADLVAFSWVYGNNSPEPWITKFMEYAVTYQTANRSAFDGTAWQKGYERELHGLSGLNPWPVSLTVSTKPVYLNATKTLMSRGKFGFPNIPMLFSQLAKYKVPDEKLRQDLVMTLLVATAQLDYMFNAFDNEKEVRTVFTEDRYSFHSRSGAHAR